MSYLDLPRIHFAGRFVARPSTVSNGSANYHRTLEEIIQAGALFWNPDGNHYWQSDGRTLRSAVGATAAADGPYADIGNLQLALFPAARPPQLLGAVGNVPYEQNASVYELPLTTQQAALAANTPLGIVRVSPGNSTLVLLAENSAGAYHAATQ